MGDKVKEGVIDLKHICTKAQIADILTKALSKSRHEELESKICLGLSHMYLVGEC